MRCSDCNKLNKSKIQRVCGAYRYGCKISKDGYMSTWINTDRLLAEIGCDYKYESDSKVEFVEDDKQLPGQMTIDDWLSG